MLSAKRREEQESNLGLALDEAGLERGGGGADLLGEVRGGAGRGGGVGGVARTGVQDGRQQSLHLGLDRLLLDADEGILLALLGLPVGLGGGAAAHGRGATRVGGVGTRRARREGARGRERRDGGGHETRRRGAESFIPEGGTRSHASRECGARGDSNGPNARSRGRTNLRGSNAGEDDERRPASMLGSECRYERPRGALQGPGVRQLDKTYGGMLHTRVSRCHDARSNTSARFLANPRRPNSGI